MRFDDVLHELRQERQRCERDLAALSEAIATFELLKNGGRRPRGRPRSLVAKTAPRYSRGVGRMPSSGIAEDRVG
jgi:hypothetical protein